MKNIITTITTIVFLLVTASFVSAGTICESEVNGIKYFTNRPTITQKCDKSWVEIKFDAKAHAARLARDKKLYKEMLKQEQMDLNKLKLKLKYKSINLDNLKYYRPYKKVNNYFIYNTLRHRPRHYINPRQDHKHVVRTLSWR